MDRLGKGSGPKKLGPSSYVLELVHDLQLQQHAESSRPRVFSEGFPSQYQLTQRAEEIRHDVFTGTQSQQWSREEHLPPAAMTKCRLSRSKRRPAPEERSDTSTPKDHIIFAESPVVPGVPVVYRPPEERAVNPDRFNLDRRHLTVCPILEGEDRLRLLNLQHNAITRLQHLSNLRRLVFLDLYDNLVHEIAGLEGLLSLRVLMLGKNRIRRISGLQTLLKLDVLDLHGNMIRDIESLSHLTHLRVLNLAGNEITCVSGLSGLHALAELNLRRNRITLVYEVDELSNLQRLFLSHNLIQSFDDIGCLAYCGTLSELTLDGNPLANATDHRQSTIYNISHLRVLDQTPITEKEKVEAFAAAREEEEKTKEMQKMAQMQEHKEVAITSIKRTWELTHPQLSSHKLVLGGSSSTQSFAGSAALMRRAQNHHLHSSSLPHLVPTYFVDTDGPCLRLYGAGSLEVLDTPPPSHGHHHQPIEEIQFHFIEFDEITPWLQKLTQNYPSLTSLTFECTNMSALEQVNALAELSSPLQSLTITSSGNPITNQTYFQPYTLYRLAHLELGRLNGTTVKDEDIVEGEQVFGKLGQMTVSRLTQARLLALMSRHRPKTSNKRSPIPTASDSLRRRCQEPLNRVALHHFSSDQERPDTTQQLRRSVAEQFSADLLSSTLTAHRKVVHFEAIWSSVLEKLVHQTLQDFSNVDENMQSLLEQL